MKSGHVVFKMIAFVFVKTKSPTLEGLSVTIAKGRNQARKIGNYAVSK